MNPLPNPTIFIPGILGTELRDTYPVDPRTVFAARSMLPLADRLTDDYDRIALHPDDQRFERVEPARVQPDRVMSLIYEEFILELRHSLAKDPAQPVPVYPFAYDWRQPLESIEDQLAQFIQEVVERTALLRHYWNSPWKSQRRVNLAAHSMGGLVVAGLLARDADAARRVGKVVTIATPYRGSVESVAKVCMGLAALGMDSSSSREREAARITPALYYLVPDFAGATSDGSSLFVQDNWQQGVIDTLLRYIRTYSVRGDGAAPKDAEQLLQSLLGAARAHRKRLNALDAPPGVSAGNWLCIVGVGEKTRTGIGVYRQGARPQFDFPEPAADGGDGTVPLEGAVPAFLDRRRLIAVSSGDFALGEIGSRILKSGVGLHASLPSMNLVQRLAVSLFQEDLEGVSGGSPFPGVTRAQWLPPSKMAVK